MGLKRTISSVYTAALQNCSHLAVSLQSHKRMGISHVSIFPSCRMELNPSPCQKSVVRGSVTAERKVILASCFQLEPTTAAAHSKHQHAAAKKLPEKWGRWILSPGSIKCLGDADNVQLTSASWSSTGCSNVLATRGCRTSAPGMGNSHQSTTFGHCRKNLTFCWSANQSIRA